MAVVDVRAVLERQQVHGVAEERHRPVAAEQTRYLHVIKSPLRDAVGAIIGLQGMFWDITEQRRAEEKLRVATSWQ